MGGGGGLVWSGWDIYGVGAGWLAGGRFACLRGSCMFGGRVWGPRAWTGLSAYVTLWLWSTPWCCQLLNHGGIGWARRAWREGRRW
ncbi:hypothetical protein EJ06DRAFT_298633 [Trichodelitschia bisporula]|uniref:Uncharacterized protein n=1 Tax=Trichodelitschia bisporula TaxID=703511 RepID=A0A6G1I745_9PEZI|nr:hypothetical protein EJ06DRAFT_298633 [Trichodelitschia bisporula]